MDLLNLESNQISENFILIICDPENLYSRVSNSWNFAKIRGYLYIVDINQSSYNKIADQWAAERHTSFVSDLVIDFASRVKSGGHILDIGCGSGHPIDSYLSEQGFQITGIDFTENLLLKAFALQLPRAKFLFCDFFDYAPDEKYDGIIAFDSFFHFPKEKQHQIYHRVADWMNPGAYLFFTHGLNGGEISGCMYGAPFYYSCLDVSTLLMLMNDAGLKVVYTNNYYIERDMERDLAVLAQRI